MSIPPDETLKTAVITGVVYPPAAAGSRLGDQKLWTLSFQLRPWRFKGHPLDEREIRIEKPGLSNEELKVWMGRIKAYQLISVHVLMLEGEHLRAEVIEFLDFDPTDDELANCASDLQKPLIQQDPLFGELTYTRSVNWWEGFTKWDSKEVKVRFTPDDSDNLEPSLLTGRTLWEAQKDWAPRIQEFAVKKLLPLKNSAWLDEDEKELTPKTFLSKMSIESISIQSDGKFSFWFHDGDLFFGHMIHVDGSLKEGITDAGIAG